MLKPCELANHLHMPKFDSYAIKLFSGNLVFNY